MEVLILQGLGLFQLFIEVFKAISLPFVLFIIILFCFLSIESFFNILDYFHKLGNECKSCKRLKIYCKISFLFSACLVLYVVTILLMSMFLGLVIDFINLFWPIVIGFLN
jgi:hypothetical protein